MHVTAQRLSATYMLIPKVSFPFYARLALILLSVVLILLLLRMGQIVIVPLVFSLLLAFFLYPLVKWLERRLRFGRGLACFSAVAAFMAVVGGLVYFLSFQIVEFSQDAPLLQARVEEGIGSFQRWIDQEYGLANSEQIAYLNEVAGGLLEGAANSVALLFLSVGAFLFWMIIVFVYTFFILFYRRLLLRALLAGFSKAHRPEVRQTVLETRSVTNNYLKGLLIEFLVVAGVMGIIFLLMGLRYALLLAVLTSLFTVIPYLGIFISLALIAAVTLVYHSPVTAAWALAARYFVHFLDGNVLVPRVVGSKVRINAFITLVGVLAGGALWGVAGTFLAIPLVATLKIVFERIPAMQPWAIMMGTEEPEDG